MKRLGMMVMGLVMMIAGASYGDVPKSINFQGRLTNSSGISLVDATYTVTISFYTVDTGGTHVWRETLFVSTKNGYFNIQLGNISPFSSQLFNDPLYVGIQVGGDAEMTPRQPLSSVPYSLSVPNGSVGRSQMQVASVGTTTLATGAVLGGNIGGNTITASNIANGTITANNIANGTITGGKIAALTITGGNLANGTITQTQASFAPTINGGISNPKIISGSGVTDANGHLYVTFSSAFTSVPIVTCNVINGGAAQFTSIYNITFTGFEVKTFNISGTTYQSNPPAWNNLTLGEVGPIGLRYIAVGN